MTFGTINIEKSLVARRDTAESKTDDRGQLMGANNNVNGEESQQQKQHNSTTCALAQHHERRGGKDNDNSSTSHTSGTRRESALPRARLTAVDRGQLPE